METISFEFGSIEAVLPCKGRGFHGVSRAASLHDGDSKKTSWIQQNTWSA